MRYQEIILENDQSDDELFGTGTMTLGLSPQQCLAVSDALRQIKQYLERSDEFDDIRQDEPADYELILRDFDRAIRAFAKQDPISAVAALQTMPINYDLDDWAMNMISKWTGVKLWDLMDLDNPDIDAAWNKAQKSMRAPHTRYDSAVAEDSASDDDLFGTQPAGARGIIYQFGRQMLSRLENSWNNPHVQQQYDDFEKADDGDAMFYLIIDITKAKFRQAMVVDNILREFTDMEGLNDFGWMIEEGRFQDLVDAWERFKNDADIESEDWFQREVQDFMGKRL